MAKNIEKSLEMMIQFENNMANWWTNWNKKAWFSSILLIHDANQQSLHNYVDQIDSNRMYDHSLIVII